MLPADQNVAILLTPPGTAAIAVIRLAGPAVGGFLEAHFSKPARVGRAVHGDLRDGGRVIDDAIVALNDAGSADLNLHGGTWVVRSALDLAARAGFVVHDSGQLPLLPEAADHPRGVLEQEVLCHLPLARTELGVRALLNQVNAWEALERRGAASREELQRMLADRTLEFLLHPPRVAIVGPANVGKSTLANQLFATERSITADVPGTTRDWVGEIANVNGLAVMLLDTPGLRQTPDRIEQAAIERSRGEIGRADLVVLVIDASRPLEGEQQSLLEEFPGAIRVLNKMDRSIGWDPGDGSSLPTIATAGAGIDALRDRIVHALCGEQPIDVRRPRCWTDRQRTAIRWMIGT